MNLPLSNEEIFSSIDLVSQCLIDTEKLEAFKRAIGLFVKPQHSVLDIGTGSGILALLAARGGAKDITAIEFDPYISKVAQRNIKANGFADKIKVVNADAKNHQFEPSTNFDVVLMEMLTTGMVDEFQVQAINNLHRQKAISENSILLPSRQESLLALSFFDFTIDGLDMTMVRHLWKHNENRHLLEFYSESLLLNEIDFSKPVEDTFLGQVELPAIKSGVINSVYFSSKTFLGENITIDDTNSLNAPVVIPLEDPIEVREGDNIILSVKYVFGGGYQNFVVNKI